MRLTKIKKLMGLLANGMQMSVVTAMMGVSSFTIKEKESIASAISFLMLLKRRKGTNKAFLVELRRLLSVCNEQELLTKISEYEDENPDLLMENTGAVESVGYDFEPTPTQRDRFKEALYKISQLVGKRELEILVALTPIPEAGKENIEVGYELFHQMESHGCIDENDTELLQEMLELLKLRAARQILLKYRRKFSPSSSTCAGDDDLTMSHPVQEMNEDSSADSPPPTTTLCIASISDDSVAVLPNAGHSAPQFNDEADTWHWNTQSLQVNFSCYTESESSDPHAQESMSSLDV